LPHANAVVLANLFKHWGMTQPEAESLADAMLGWMKRNHVYTSAVQPDYESSALPYVAPGRSLRSYHELAAIEKAREVFYDSEGRPNHLWQRFVDTVSLLDFQRPNINGAKPDTMIALGQFDETQQQNLNDYLRGTGNYQNQGPQFFQAPNEAQRITGPAGNANAFAATISALRITIIVRDGTTDYRLSTVIAPPNGATTVQTNASAGRTQTSAATARTAQQQQNRPNAAQAAARPGTNPANPAQNAAAARNLRYPFTLLEIRENDEIPAAPPPPATPLT
jgi:general secretion pathway protein K